MDNELINTNDQDDLKKSLDQIKNLLINQAAQFQGDHLQQSIDFNDQIKMISDIVGLQRDVRNNKENIAKIEHTIEDIYNKLSKIDISSITKDLEKHDETLSRLDITAIMKDLEHHTELLRKLENELDDIQEKIKTMLGSIDDCSGGLNQMKLAVNQLKLEKKESSSNMSKILWAIAVPVIVTLIICLLNLILKEPIASIPGL